MLSVGRIIRLRRIASLDRISQLRPVGMAFVRMFSTMGQDDDPWQILGVDKTTPRRMVKERYRELAKKWHPDMHKGADRESAEKEFKRIHTAFRIVSGAERGNLMQWAAQRAEEEMARGRYTNAQVTMYVCGLAACTLVVAHMWGRMLQRRQNERVDSNWKERHAILEQTRRWQEDLTNEEVNERMQEVKAETLSIAAQNGAIGAMMYGGTVSLVAFFIKLLGNTEQGKFMLNNPFMAFHARTPTLLFYISSATGMGFFLEGVKALSPQHRLGAINRTHAAKEFAHDVGHDHDAER